MRVTPAPPHNPSAMPTEHRLFLRVLQGLREGEAIRLYCHDSEDTVNRQRKWATSRTKVNGHLGLALAPPRK